MNTPVIDSSGGEPTLQIRSNALRKAQAELDEVEMMKPSALIIAFTITAATAGAVHGQTLDVSSMEAYESSVAALSAPLDKRDRRHLALSIAAFALAEFPLVEKSLAMERFLEHPDEFFARIQQLHGMTAKDIGKVAQIPQ